MTVEDSRAYSVHTRPGGPVVKAWDHGVPMEPDVWKQVDNIAAVPGVERIAVMPDAHIGNGACVGSAILTRDRVLPAAVGVDIGCFDGDTRVPLLDGSQRSLRDLAASAEPCWVYSIDGQGRVAPGRAVARLTRRAAALVKVVIAGGDEIVCTPDHPFMLSDGTYRAAEALRFNDSLMPLYRKWQTRDGYESVSHGQRSSRMTHELVYEAVNGPMPPGSVVHHKNHNPFDNRPENLELMTSAEHSAHHRRTGRGFEGLNTDPEFQKARVDGLRRAMEDAQKRARKVEVATRTIVAYMRERPEDFARAVAGNGQRGAAVLRAFNVRPRRCPECDAQQPNPAALRWHRQRQHAYNHKVLSITPLDRRADVYCLQVEEHHNFALAAGVFVHNCGMIAAPLELRRSELKDLARVRSEIEQRVPVGRTNRGQKGDRGAWGTPPEDVKQVWHAALERDYRAMVKKYHELDHPFVVNHLGTLGTGNHFLEVCIELDTGDPDPRVWLMLHSGSRGIGNRIGTWFTRKARTETQAAGVRLPDPELGFLTSGTELFDDYLRYAEWAQGYAWQNRLLMFDRALAGIAAALGASSTPYAEDQRVHCLAGETRVLTRQGVFPIRELVGGEHDLLTTGGQWVRAPIRSFGTQPLMKVTLSRNGVRKAIYATAGHRWLLRAFGSTGNAYIRRRTEATTQQLLPGDRLAYAFPGRPTDLAADGEGVARGFLFGDGYVNAYGTAKAQFCGAKDEALLPYFAEYRAPRHYADRTVVSGLPRAWKTDYPRLDAPPAYLYGWLAGYFAADGDVGKTGRPTLSSARRANLEMVRAVGAQVGVGTYALRTHMRRGFGQVATPLYLLGLMRGDLDAQFFVLPSHRERFLTGQSAIERRGWTVVSVEPTERIEEVFCAQVNGTHAFALEDNILTGNCHHNYVAQEEHFGGLGWLTRKGAVNAGAGVRGIIPGSMGARSYITRGKGEPEALKTSSHGAGRVMSRNVARRSISLEQHLAALAGVECRTDPDVIDESPACYKPIDDVMAAQAELTEPLVALKQIVVVKG